MTENFVCTGEYPHNSSSFAVLLHMDWALMQNTLAASLSPSHSSSLLKTTLTTNMEKQRCYQQDKNALKSNLWLICIQIAVLPYMSFYNIFGHTTNFKVIPSTSLSLSASQHNYSLHFIWQLSLVTSQCYSTAYVGDQLSQL